MTTTAQRTGADPIDPYAGLEAWRFTGAGTLWVKRMTGQFGAVQDVKVVGGVTFHLTPAERRLNSDMAASPEQDPFTNGTCVPMRLTDLTPAEDKAAIEANTATMTDEQIKEMLGGHPNALPKRLATITNTVTLARILEIGQSPDVDASNSKITHIRNRIIEIAPDLLNEGAQRTRIESLPGEDEPDGADVRGQLDGELARGLGD